MSAAGGAERLARQGPAQALPGGRRRAGQAGDREPGARRAARTASSRCSARPAAARPRCSTWSPGSIPTSRARSRLPEPARIGYVFQEPRLLPWRTVEDNLRLVLPERCRERGQDRPLARRDGARRRARGVSLPAVARHGAPRRRSRGPSSSSRRCCCWTSPSSRSTSRPPTACACCCSTRSARHPATALFVTHNLREAIMLADRIVAAVADADPGAARDRGAARAGAALRSRRDRGMPGRRGRRAPGSGTRRIAILCEFC